MLESGSEAAGEGHFGQRDRQTAFAEVVAGAHKAGLNRAMESGEGGLGLLGIDLRDGAAR